MIEIASLGACGCWFESSLQITRISYLCKSMSDWFRLMEHKLFFSSILSLGAKFLSWDWLSLVIDWLRGFLIPTGCTIRCTNRHLPFSRRYFKAEKSGYRIASLQRLCPQVAAFFFVSLPQIDSDVLQSLPPIYLAGRYDLSCRTHHLCRNQPPVAA